MWLSGSELALHYEKSGELNKAYKEYLKKNNFKKAANMLEKMNDWHRAANIYIEKNEIDLARRAIENCFKRGKNWESFEPSAGKSKAIEDWLKENKQTQRFVRYIHNTKRLDPKGIPLIIKLADKLVIIKEFKHAAQLYNNGFFLINNNISQKKMIKNEEWLMSAAECYSKIGKYEEAAICMKDLVVTEVEIGEDISNKYKSNPYRNYKMILEKTRQLNFLSELLEHLGDFDPFNIAYDLIKMNEFELSKRHFFKYFGRIVKKNLTDQEREIRNKKIIYCLNQYMIYHRARKEYILAAEMAQLNSQKKISADLYKLANLSNQNRDSKGSDLKKVKIEPISAMNNSNHHENLSCPHCGEKVEPEWDTCPNCKNSLMLNICSCGEKIQPHWKVCPACGKNLS